MKTAIVTGGSSGIGLSISKKILSLGYKVYALGRDFSKVDFNDANFHPMICDLTHTQDLMEKVNRIRKKEDIYILINNAGVGYFGLHEEIHPKKIHEMIAINLEAPLVLTQMLLRNLKKIQGWIINISSIEAKKSSTHGCVYGASKAGLSHFCNSLFDEARKTGLKVVTIHPDMTKTPFYDHASFREGESKDSYLLPESIADTVENILNQRAYTVITDLTIRPQKHQIRRKK